MSAGEAAGVCWGKMVGILFRGVLFCWLTAVILASEARAGTAATNWFTGYSAESFRKVPAAMAALDPAAIDRDLLDAAVFHETNRRRQQHGLPALRFDAKAREAARMHSDAMAKHGFVGHENRFDRQRATMSDRGQMVGLRPALLAENVASTFARRYNSGDAFYVREENGRQIQSATPKGPQIPMRTYLEFAEAVLDGWMNSPGHRKNVLLKNAEYLGTACAPGSDRRELEKFYCTQVFYSPLR